MLRWLIVGCAISLLALTLVALGNHSGMPDLRPEPLVSRGLPATAGAVQLEAPTCQGARCVSVDGWASDWNAEGISVQHDWLMRVFYGATPPYAAPFNSAELPNVYIMGLACPSATQCVVAAESNIPPGSPSEWPELGIVTRSRMSFVKRPHAPYLSHPFGVACGAVGWCVVPIQADARTLVETYRGSSWSPLVAVPGIAEFDALACPSSRTCFALGTGPKGEALLTVTPSAMTVQWKVIQHGGIVPSRLACHSAAACVIVGVDKNPGAGANGILDVGRIAVQTVSKGRLLPAMDLTRSLYSPSIGTLSCSSDTRCVAGGSDTGYEGVGRAIVLAEVSGSWSVDRSSLASLNANGFAAVTDSACNGQGRCLFSGSYSYEGPTFLSSLPSGPTRPFLAFESTTGIERLSNLGAKNDQPGEIVCPASTDCLVWDGSRLLRVNPIL